MDSFNLPHQRGTAKAQLTMLSTSGLRAWVTTFHHQPPVLSIDALGTQIRITLPHTDRHAELAAVRQLVSVIATFADKTESGWLYPAAPRPHISDETLQRVIAGLRAL